LLWCRSLFLFFVLVPDCWLLVSESLFSPKASRFSRKFYVFQISEGLQSSEIFIIRRDP
jgi:hypothetical protein